MLTFIKVIPELGDLGQKSMITALPASVYAQLDRNRCIGRLLGGVTPHRATGVPLSVWALVIERVNRKDKWLAKDAAPSRQVNVIYEILQGPALVGRESLGYYRIWRRPYLSEF